MTNKSLKGKAISIKGKAYVLVSDRVIFFNENYPNGLIKTRLLSDPNADMVVVKAQVTPDIDKPDRFFTGHSQAKWGEGMVNKTAALENAETSAVGRALAMLGIGVIDSVASVDEIQKAKINDPIMEVTRGMGAKVRDINEDRPATEAQKKMIFAVAKESEYDSEKIKEVVKTKFGLNSFNDLTVLQAKKVIDGLLKKSKDIKNS